MPIRVQESPRILKAVVVLRNRLVDVVGCLACRLLLGVQSLQARHLSSFAHLAALLHLVFEDGLEAFNDPALLAHDHLLVLYIVFEDLIVLRQRANLLSQPLVVFFQARE